MDAAAIADVYFVVAIDQWPADSQYPLGHFVRALGPIGALDAEIDTILVERQIAVSQAALGFSAASLREMPADCAQRPWAPDPAEAARRRDLRGALVFSIDPRGSQDIDDAVSMRRTAAGFELGVHIADVTHFVAPGSATDREALARGTTVYLADRRFNMLPEVLSERVCSLRGGCDRYAVSVVWDLDPAYAVRSVWFGRTLIRSACEMHYEQAQALLDGRRAVPGLDPAAEEPLRAAVVALAAAMRALRQRRRAAGALELASTEVKFGFDPATRAVAEVAPKPALEIHRVIEEAMVFANAAVARRIHQALPAAALLRRHRAPQPARFDRLARALRARGFALDCASSAALAASLQAVVDATPADAHTAFLAKAMATLAMQEADYFATGDCPAPAAFAHYGLAEPFYTHFTSPIRRYADVVVHRQLLAALAAQGAGDLDPAPDLGPLASRQWVADTAARLNERNRMSKIAQRESTELFQSRYVAQRTAAGQPLVADGVVAEVRTNGLIVYVPQFGIRGPVHLRDRSGRIRVPLSALTGSPLDMDRHVDGCDGFEATPDRLSIRLPADAPHAALFPASCMRFSVFDRVRVALRVLATRRRRPPVYLTLVASSSPRRPVLTQLKRGQPAAAANGPPPAAPDPGPDPVSSTAPVPDRPAPGKRPKKRPVDYYAVLEKFGQLSLLETRCDPQSV